MGSSNKDITEIRRLGTCRVNFGGRDLGYTQGGCEVTITTDWVDINVDDFGTVPVDAIDVGTNIEVKVPLAQASLDNYDDAYGMGDRSSLGVRSYDRITFGRTTGDSIVKRRLVLDPLNDTDNIILYLAGAISVDPLGFNNDGVRILGITFRAYIDTGRAEGDRLFRIGGAMS